MAVTQQNSKPATTHYRVLERFGDFTHIRCVLETGRTHQIRVHMAYIGHPLAGDPVYGPRRVITSLGGQCLHAGEIGFIHPRTGAEMRFEAPLPPYFTSFYTLAGKRKGKRMNQKDFSNWLVVSDIDGTLNNKARKLPRRNYDAIQAFTEAGGNFTLASGRLTSSLKRNYDRITPNQPAVVLNGAGIYDFQQEKMIWRSTIQQEGHEFVRYIINKFSDSFKSVDVGIYFDDYVYIVKNGVLSQGTMDIDKAHYEVTTIDKVPKEGWMKVIFWSNPITMNRLRYVIDRSDTAGMNFMASSPWSMEMLQRAPTGYGHYGAGRYAGH